MASAMGERRGKILRIRGPEDFSAAFGVSREVIHRLEMYECLLRRWQQTINLVAPSTLDDIWHRHFADSAQLVPLAGPVRRWIDLGSGAGFPGLMVAILLADLAPSSPQAKGELPRVILIESSARKCAFLREVVRDTRIAPSVSVDILSTRIEVAATQASLAGPDVVSARALAPLSRLLELSAPLFGSRTVGLFLKGRDAAAELENAKKLWSFNAELIPSRTEAGAHVVAVRDLETKGKTRGRSS
jgi:16S rRNA (guanine527-N7)-methyltransferase